jgi:hypothetical protein
VESGPTVDIRIAIEGCGVKQAKARAGASEEEIKRLIKTTLIPRPRTTHLHMWNAADHPEAFAVKKYWMHKLESKPQKKEVQPARTEVHPHVQIISVIAKSEGRAKEIAVPDGASRSDVRLAVEEVYGVCGVRYAMRVRIANGRPVYDTTAQAGSTYEVVEQSRKTSDEQEAEREERPERGETGAETGAEEKSDSRIR